MAAGLTGAHPSAPVWSDREARFYAAAIDGSDYAPAAAATLRSLLGEPGGEGGGGVLDIGAGAGQPVAAWLPASARWTAVEPNRYLRARLGRLARTTHPGLLPVDATWEVLHRLRLPPHEVALAANTGGPFSSPRELLASMRAHARRAVAWIVPAQRGPRRWCLAGALPPGLHGEDERPAASLLLDALGPGDRPVRSALFRWTFRARFPDLAAAGAHCAARLGWPEGDPRRVALGAHLAETARRLAGGGVEISAPKLSALLVWDAGR